jgi:hypothetical protein
MKFWIYISLFFSSAIMAQDDIARLRPPSKVTCSRDHLTSYTGRVIDYRRKMNQTTLRIATVWGTIEAIAIDHPGSNDPGDSFLINGKTFLRSDWKQVETSEGQLRAGVRATAWVCDDGRNPVIDWLPPDR